MTEGRAFGLGSQTISEGGREPSGEGIGEDTFHSATGDTARPGRRLPDSRGPLWRIAALSACAAAVCAGGVGLAAALGLFDGSERAAPVPVTPVVQSASPTPTPSSASPRPSASPSVQPQSGATTTPDEAAEEPVVTGPVAEDGAVEQWDPAPGWSGSDNTWDAPDSGGSGYWDNSDGDDATGSVHNGEATPTDEASETPDPEPGTGGDPTDTPATDPSVTPDPGDTGGGAPESGGN